MLARSHHIEQKITEFENDNQVSYTTINDEFKVDYGKRKKSFLDDL